MVSSTGTFVSCKDYDDDIENLQGQINANAEAIKTINDLVAKGSVISSVEPTANGIIIKLSDGKSTLLKTEKTVMTVSLLTFGLLEKTDSGTRMIKRQSIRL